MKSREILLGEATLHPDSRSLLGRDGEPLDLRYKSMDVLLILASTPGETVSKNTLIDQVWQESAASDEGLVQCIADIRRALGDRGKSIVENIPRRGYRLNVSTQITDHVIAVLPLDHLGASDPAPNLGDALSEGIITDLARFPQFSVVARNSSFQFRGRATDLHEIASVLSADYVVEGSQQLDGKNIRVTIRLIDTRTGTCLYSEKIDRKIADLFEIQDEIVWHVAAAVGGAILTHMPSTRSGGDVNSLLRGLQARELLLRSSRENWEAALELAETSIRLDPKSPWGYLGKALDLIHAVRSGWREGPRDEILREAEILARRALFLAPYNYMSHFSLARVLQAKAEHVESILHFQRAATLNPSDSLVLIGMSEPLFFSGETDRAIEMLLKAKSVDPLHGDWLLWQLAWAYWQNGAYDKGIEALLARSTLSPECYKMLAALYSGANLPDKAQQSLTVFLIEKPGYNTAKENEEYRQIWIADGALGKWLDHLRSAGLPEG